MKFIIFSGQQWWIECFVFKLWSATSQLIYIYMCVCVAGLCRIMRKCWSYWTSCWVKSCHSLRQLSLTGTVSNNWRCPLHRGTQTTASVTHDNTHIANSNYMCSSVHSEITLFWVIFTQFQGQFPVSTYTEALALSAHEFGTVCRVAYGHLTSATDILRCYWRHIFFGKATALKLWHSM